MEVTSKKCKDKPFVDIRITEPAAANPGALRLVESGVALQRGASLEKIHQSALNLRLSALGCAQDHVMTSYFRQVSKRFVALAVAALMFVPFAAAGAADDGLIIVKLDIAKVVKVPDKVQTVILGNPIIADVTLLRGGTQMVITGKGFGDTNLILLDRSGNMIANSTIRVVQAEEPLVIVQRGMERESYACAPRCQPTVELGDTAGYSNGWAGAIQARNGLATPGQQASPAAH